MLNPVCSAQPGVNLKEFRQAGVTSMQRLKLKTRHKF